MKDGYVQQVATPQEVFDHPSNLFVAGFIGTPQMNFFDAELKLRDGDYWVDVEGASVRLAEEKQARLKANGVPEQAVTLGVRPEHLLLADKGISGRVAVSELMGSSRHLHLTVDGKDVIIIVPSSSTSGTFIGSEVSLSFDGSTAHIFSKETEKNLEY